MSNELEETAHLSDRKIQILQAAIEIIVSEGYGKLTMRALARASGMKLGALQYHFRTWEDMLRALAAYISDAYRRSFEALDLNDLLLKSLAEETGGRYFSLLSLGQLEDVIRMRTEERQVRREIRLWNAPFLFIAFVMLVTAEWILRKRRQLS